MVNDLNIKYININITNKKTRNVLTEKHFNLIGEGYEKAIFLDSLLNILLNYKSYTKNIDINVFSDSIFINCYYNKLYGNHSKIINSYLKLMHQLEDAYDSYYNFIKDFC